MDACELSEFITPCERTPGAPEKPIGSPYVRLGVKSRRFASILIASAEGQRSAPPPISRRAISGMTTAGIPRLGLLWIVVA